MDRDADTPLDEFDFIARVLRPLTGGAPEALGLADDAAIIPGRPGRELVITTDAIVEGVHFLPDDPPELVARKLLRVNLSDLAAKAAEPSGYFLNVSWPAPWGRSARETFAAGLAEDQAAFGLKLFGGDTTSTPGPFTASVTLLGWARESLTVKRAGARAGDVVLVSGTIGDGWLGLQAARGELPGLTDSHREWLADRYRLPQPRLGLAEALRRHATASADVSDGLLADCGHIARASGVGVMLELDDMPLSPAARAWLPSHPDHRKALAALAAGGDDYEVVCTVPAEAVTPMIVAGQDGGVALTRIGKVIPGDGVEALADGEALLLDHTGWRHP